MKKVLIISLIAVFNVFLSHGDSCAMNLHTGDYTNLPKTDNLTQRDVCAELSFSNGIRENDNVCKVDLDDAGNVNLLNLEGSADMVDAAVDSAHAVGVRDSYGASNLNIAGTVDVVDSTNDTLPIEVRKTAANGNNGGSSITDLLKLAVQVVLKEPIRLVQFAIKTDKLKKEGHVIPKMFTFCTTMRFMGSAIFDGCCIASWANQLVDKPFLQGKTSWIWFGAFGVSEVLTCFSRAIVKGSYGEASSLYGDAAIAPADGE